MSTAGIYTSIAAMLQKDAGELEEGEDQSSVAVALVAFLAQLLNGPNLTAIRGHISPFVREEIEAQLAGLWSFV